MYIYAYMLKPFVLERLTMGYEIPCWYLAPDNSPVEYMSICIGFVFTLCYSVYTVFTLPVFIIISVQEGFYRA